MSDALIVLHTAIAIIAIVLLIVVAKVDPLISLVIGTLYLGVAAGLGFGGTIGSLTQGFGDIMAEVGLEAAPIGWQLFALGNSRSDRIAFIQPLVTYATRLLAQALTHRLWGPFGLAA